MTSSTSNHVATALAYYTAMNNEDLNGVANNLHSEVQLIGPLANLEGKEAVLEAAKRYMSFVQTINVKSSYSSEHQVLLTYDAHFDDPIGVCRTAVQMTFRDDLIARIELFFDASPFR